MSLPWQKEPQNLLLTLIDLSSLPSKIRISLANVSFSFDIRAEKPSKYGYEP
jgi:hypothetical protein